MRYRAALNTHSSFFNKPINELSKSRIKFLEWLDFYHNIDKLNKDRPSRDIIENDILLDEWLKNFIAKKEQDERTPSKFRSKRQHQKSYKFG